MKLRASGEEEKRTKERTNGSLGVNSSTEEQEEEEEDRLF